jgi:5-methylcytosine-specific restriction protein A
MTTYLLTWNPSRFSWWDLEEDLFDLQKNGYLVGNWSCSNTQKIRPDDRVFLIRLGIEPKGIIGSGWALSYPYPDEHWDENADENRQMPLYIDIEWDVLLHPGDILLVLPLSELNHGSLRKVNWTPQRSGITIPEDVVTKLEDLWSERLLSNGIFQQFTRKAASDRPAEVYWEGAATPVVTTRYERNASARKRCLKSWGYTCVVCGFNFEEFYGPIGKEYIHVHHVMPLAEIKELYQLNPETDLVPVCPNCHAMIHRRKPAYQIDDLRKMIQG